MNEPLQDIERALLQILIAYKVIEAPVLENIFKSLKIDYPDQSNNSTLADIFKKLNAHLRKLSLEIKSVVIKSTTSSEMIYFHGIVNIEDDFIATEFGSQFTDLEIEFIREIMNLLLDLKKIGINEIRNIPILPINKASNVVDKLLVDKWLIRNSVGYFEIGARSYLEIRQFLESELGKRENSNALPQVLYY